MLNNIQRKIIMCISNYYHAAMSMLPAIDIYNNIKKDKQSGNFGKGVQSNLKQKEKGKGSGIL
jgi:hypothetical protein